MSDAVKILARALAESLYDGAFDPGNIWEKAEWDDLSKSQRAIFRRSATALLAQIKPLLVAEEREACAALGDFADDCPMSQGERGVVSAYAAAIRARKG